MKIQSRRNAGFTLVEIMIVVAIIGLLAAIAIPNFVKARNTAQANACINNLRQVDSAVQQWALENGKKDADTITPGEVTAYIKGNAMPKCPANKDVDYVFGGSVGATPVVQCTPGEALTPAHKL